MTRSPRFLRALDGRLEALARQSARQLSRRGMLGRLGLWAAGATLLPLLPVDRAAQAAQATPSAEAVSRFAQTAQADDPTRCNYWRYCAGDGYLCACCGGGPSTCPPGSSPSPTAWIGSCVYPGNGRTYLVAYRDCCGVAACGRCGCNATEGEMPSYQPQLNGDVVWCFGTSSMVYHCSTAALVGPA